MSSSMPPGGPGQPEYLAPGGGDPLVPQPAPSRSRKPLVLGAVAVGAAALLGGAAFAAYSFLATGPQPAEALPATTLGYLAVDLDPSGGQKIEAVRTLRKFPAIEEELGLDSDDDLKQSIVEALIDESGCEGLDYDDDLAPWLGDRAAVAAFADAGEDAGPSVALVLQVGDAGQAEDGLAAIDACGGSEEQAGWVVADGWAVVAETQDQAQQIVDAAADAPLSDDASFTKWTEAAGDSGIVSGYLAPGAGELMGEAGAMGLSMFGMPAGGGEDAVAEFAGAAMTVRFDDGAVELEAVGDAKATEVLDGSGAGALVSSLPADTAAAIGFAPPDGWFTTLVDQLVAAVGDGSTSEDFMAELSAQTGLDLPADVETLTGEALAVAVGGDIDADALESGDLSSLPVGVKVRGDAAAIESVLDKLRAQAGPDASVLETDSEGDVVVAGPSADYRARLLESGGLGDSDAFQDAVPDADRAAAIFYLDFDAGDNWLAELAGDDAEAQANIEPLSALGFSAWGEDGVAHSRLRLSTD